MKLCYRAWRKVPNESQCKMIYSDDFLSLARFFQKMDNDSEARYIVMPYIGIDGANHWSIYEDDIVHIEKDKFGEGKHEVWTIEYDSSIAAFVCFNQLNSVRGIEYNEIGEPICNVYPGFSFLISPIGNRYETPELLN